jgi:hypothetical protein
MARGRALIKKLMKNFFQPCRHRLAALANVLAAPFATPFAAALAALGFVTLPAHAGGEQTLERVIINGNSTGLVGVADSADSGTVTQKQLEARTVYRAGELLEATPGLIVSQHSGEGKASHCPGEVTRCRAGRAHRSDSRLANFAVALPLGLRLGAAVCRRCRHHRSGQAQSAHWL